MNVVQEIQDFNAGREPERLRLKLRNMRSDPFVFMRGTNHLFQARLAGECAASATPAVWLCGDLHLENFGSYKGDNRLVYFDINDFDDAALGPAALDLARFLASVLVGAKTMKVSRGEALALAATFADVYAKTLATGKARWVERETAGGLVRQLLDDLRSRERAKFLDARTELREGKRGKKRRIKLDGQHALPVTDAQRERVTDAVNHFATLQTNPRFFKVLDVAQRVAGGGSLGLDRYVVLVKGKGSPDGNYLLDIKQAMPSPLPAHVDQRQPKWKTEAHRIVALQQRMQAISMAFLAPLRIGKRAYVLRALQPTQDRVRLDRRAESWGQIQGVIGVMAECLAWAQLRGAGREGSATADELIAFGSTREWRKPLLACAEAGARQVMGDWQEYAAAYDDGAFDA